MHLKSRSKACVALTLYAPKQVRKCLRYIISTGLECIWTPKKTRVFDTVFFWKKLYLNRVLFIFPARVFEHVLHEWLKKVFLDTSRMFYSFNIIKNVQIRKYFCQNLFQAHRIVNTWVRIDQLNIIITINTSITS